MELMYHSGQATKLFVLFSVLGQRAPTKYKWVFVALVLETTGEWEAVLMCLPYRKEFCPGFSVTFVCPLLLFFWPLPTLPLCALFKKLAPVLECTLKDTIHLINSKQVYLRKHQWLALLRKVSIIMMNRSCLTFRILLSI